jgi:hypothetical protein
MYGGGAWTQGRVFEPGLSPSGNAEAKTFKSFLLLFFKKEDFSVFSRQHVPLAARSFAKP